MGFWGRQWRRTKNVAKDAGRVAVDHAESAAAVAAFTGGTAACSFLGPGAVACGAIAAGAASSATRVAKRNVDRATRDESDGARLKFVTVEDGPPPEHVTPLGEAGKAATAIILLHVSGVVGEDEAAEQLNTPIEANGPTPAQWLRVTPSSVPKLLAAARRDLSGALESSDLGLDGDQWQAAVAEWRTVAAGDLGTPWGAYAGIGAASLAAIAGAVAALNYWRR